MNPINFLSLAISTHHLIGPSRPGIYVYYLHADLFCISLFTMISVQQWRAAIGCFFGPKASSKPIVTGEQGGDVVLALIYVLIHSVSC